MTKQTTNNNATITQSNQTSLVNTVHFNQANSQAFLDDVQQALKQICEQHAVNLDRFSPEISGAGKKLNLALNVTTQSYNTNRESKPYFRKTGQSQAEMRFEQHHQLLGLAPELLNSEVKVNHKFYRLLGLYGRNHQLLLAPLFQSTDKQPLRLSINDFYQQYHS